MPEDVQPQTAPPTASNCPFQFKVRWKLVSFSGNLFFKFFRPFACKKCDLSFKTKSNLINHQVVHSGEKKHVCDICRQSFVHKTSLNLHIQAHQGNDDYFFYFTEINFLFLFRCETVSVPRLWKKLYAIRELERPCANSLRT